MSKKRIAVVVGSARKASYSKQIADVLIGMMPDKYELVPIKIDDLAIYNQDYDDEGTAPENYARFREEIGSADGYLFVTPEYNRSMPALIKNALDIASRPYGQNAWGGKPGAVVSVSIGGIAGFGANHALRQSLAFLDVYTMQQPEAYIGNVAGMLDENGTVKDERSRAFLQSIADSFANWIDKF